MKNCFDGKIDYKTCRKHGEQFSLENIAPKYEKYFQDVLNTYIGDGWYTRYDLGEEEEVVDTKEETPVTTNKIPVLKPKPVRPKKNEPVSGVIN